MLIETIGEKEFGQARRRVCLVTGAAPGIGRGIAVGLARQGAKVGAADINGDGAAKVASEIGLRRGRTN
jgi:NAD(P)-dependent dehydrogenase (short-subunit alcohol dehydrogenase family)